MDRETAQVIVERDGDYNKMLELVQSCFATAEGKKIIFDMTVAALTLAFIRGYQYREKLQ